MADRIVNTDTVNTGVWTCKGVVGSTGQVASIETATYHATRYRRERAPTGGKALPKQEKPFTNGTLQVNYPNGPLIRDLLNGYLYHSTGPHANAFTMRDPAGDFDGRLAFPMNGTPRFPSPTVSAFYPPGINPDLLSQTEVKALNKLREKSTEDSLSFGLVLAERRETAQLFTEGAQALYKLALAIKAKRPSEAMDVILNDLRMIGRRGISDAQMLRRTKKAMRTSKSLLECMSSLTLMWNLGISPLLQDLQAAVTLLQTGLLTKDWNIKSVSRYSRTINDREPKSWPRTGVSAETTVSETHGYTVTLIGKPRFTTGALQSQLGLSNIPSLLYQGTSGTFIIDYFYALGPWLDALEVPSMFDFAGGSYTQKVSRILNLEVRSAGGTMKGGYVLNYVKRRLYSSFPIPIPPLSLRERELTDKQTLNTGLVALQKLKKLLG